MGGIVNYWDINYSYDDYVAQLNDPGYPYAIDKVSKEIFKRLYHNMSYLVKKKGTISGLRQLINIWGIPNTILRINEFGGKNKDNLMIMIYGIIDIVMLFPSFNSKHAKCFSCIPLDAFRKK
jgi:hypothetical protein